MPGPSGARSVEDVEQQIRSRAAAGLLATVTALTACSGSPADGPATRNSATALRPELRTAAPVRIAAAGDIAERVSTAGRTAAVVERLDPDLVLTTGDNAYPSGRAQDYAKKYDPTWGRFKDRTRPTPGNHDYRTPGAAAYFDYFAEQTGRKPYYAWNAGAWRFYSLNSEIDARVGSPQETWLRKDLAAHPGRNVLAFWHQPLFTCSERHGPEEETQPLWNALAEAGADVVLTGHNHAYERFETKNAGGRRAEDGLRQFVTGAGGAELYELTEPCAGREAGADDAYGVLALTLRPTGYDWAWHSVDGRVQDQGSDTTA